MDLNKLLEFAEKCAKENGKLIIESAVDIKSFKKTDKYFNEVVEEKIVEQTYNSIKINYPDHLFLNKSENKTISNKDFEWISDPIDGAFVYCRGWSMCVTSMALTKDGESILAVVYDPWNNKLFHAIKGKGAYLNDNKIEVNNNVIEKQTFIDTEWWPMAKYDVEEVIHKLSKEKLIYSIHIGSVIQSACLVAQGVLSATLFGGYVHGKNHEAAAVKLIVEESGGIFTDLKGDVTGFIGDIKGFIISNKNCHNDLVERCKVLFPSNE